MLDSFRQDHIGVYHGGERAFERIKPCQTPHIDEFSQRCVIFENVYPCGLPTIPVRYELMTGQFSLPFREWCPLTPYDLTLAEILREYGYVNAFITDTYHFRAPGMNYHRGFHEIRWIQGQEYDPYRSCPLSRKIENYVNQNYFNPPGTQKGINWVRRVSQFLSNTENFKSEEDYFPSRVVEESTRWLRENRKYEKIFLWIDSFDPHEPWDPPPRFDTYTDPSYRGPRLILPMGGEAKSWASEEEINYIRGLYAGEASFVDFCLGKLFKVLEEEGYFEDSLIILTADHGHPLADHGKFLKGPERMYNELLKIPFLVRLPGGENGGLKSDALIQFPDVLPTILEFLGLENNNIPLAGKSFLPVLKGDKESHREAVISGFKEGKERCIRNKEWSLIERAGGKSELYHLKEDKKERKNLIKEFPEIARELSSCFGKIFRAKKEETLGVQGQYEMSSAAIG